MEILLGYLISSNNEFKLTFHFKDLEIEPIVLAYHKHKAQLSLKIKGQSIAFNLSNMNVNKMDIIATLPIGKSDHGVVTLEFNKIIAFFLKKFNRSIE
jgi:hypothetical protein